MSYIYIFVCFSLYIYIYIYRFLYTHMHILISILYYTLEGRAGRASSPRGARRRGRVYTISSALLFITSFINEYLFILVSVFSSFYHHCSSARRAGCGRRASTGSRRRSTAGRSRDNMHTIYWYDTL